MQKAFILAIQLFKHVQTLVLHEPKWEMLMVRVEGRFQSISVK